MEPALVVFDPRPLTENWASFQVQQISLPEQDPPRLSETAQHVQHVLNSQHGRMLSLARLAPRHTRSLQCHVAGLEAELLHTLVSGSPVMPTWYKQ